MKNINTNLKYLILLWIVLFFAIIPVYAHQGHLLIDCGREVYYPTQILLGKVLYKDILNIYGPFSYMFNAFLFKIFGVNLNVLYIAGCLCSFAIVTLIYKIAAKFLPEFLSLTIGIYTISIGVLSLNLFNFVFPYSYGMLYGLVSFLISIWLLFKYQENPNKTFYLYLSSFFAGLCITSKYEFMPYLIVILYAIIKIKPLKFKQYYFTVFSLLFMPVFCFGILFLQGLAVTDLVSTVSIIKKMAQSQTLNYFYSTQGVYLQKNTIPVMLYNFLKTIIPLGLMIYGFKTSRKWISISLVILSVILMLCWIGPASFIFFPIFTVILAIVNYKILLKNIPLMILTLAAITMSLKSFWGLATLNYGVFFASFLLITIITLIFEIFKIRNLNIPPIAKSMSIYILIVSAILAFQNMLNIKGTNYFLKTDRGGIYITKPYYQASEELIKYINANTKKTDRIVIYPEGAFINFLTNRNTDDYYLSMLPLYVETMGEENVINHFKKTKPEYIIFNNWKTSDYYFNYICSDYALGFCSYVAENYTQEKVIDSGFRYLIFKRK